MAYADQKMGGGKIAAIVIVALIHALLGYAFVTGLAYQYVKKAAEDMDVFDVEEPPPPPPPDEPPPPPPPDQPMTPPPVVSPPPIVRTPTPPVQIQTVQTPPPAVVMTPVTAPPAPPAPVAPPAPRVSQAAKVSGNPGQFFGPDAYPESARDAGAQGLVRASLTVGTNGRVTACTVTASSGNKALDDTTCRISIARVRYTPAKDDNGNPIQSTVTLPVRWQLPND